MQAVAAEFPGCAEEFYCFLERRFKTLCFDSIERNRSGGCRALHISTLLFAAFATSHQPLATSHF